MPEVAIRPYVDEDEADVLDLLAASLGKTVDERYRGFFRWKHLENPFGRSFMWVAEVDGRLAGFRAFLRWRFIDPSGDPLDAVRAVDTATSPDFRGLGIFRELTMHGLSEMRPQGIDFVFNTPNDQSRPGYLKMGWEVEGRVSVKVRPRSPRSLWRMVRARTAAEPWSLPVDLGVPVDDLDDQPPEVPVPGVLRTDRGGAFLQWRYAGFPAVGSVALVAGRSMALVRFRRRGTAIECTVGDVLGQPEQAAVSAGVRQAMRHAGADYAIATASTPVGGMLRIDRLGPIQTRRKIAERSSVLPLALVLGDVELF